MKSFRRRMALLAALCCLCAAPSALAGQYIFPDSHIMELTRSEIWAWDYESLEYACHEIFARHGYVFEPGGKFEDYFTRMPWYVPNANPDNHVACYPFVSALEWRNEHLIKAVREEMALKGTTNPEGKSIWRDIDAPRPVPDIPPMEAFSLTMFRQVSLMAGQLLPVHAALSAVDAAALPGGGLPPNG